MVWLTNQDFSFEFHHGMTDQSEFLFEFHHGMTDIIHHSGIIKNIQEFHHGLANQSGFFI